MANWIVWLLAALSFYVSSKFLPQSAALALLLSNVCTLRVARLTRPWRGYLLIVASFTLAAFALESGTVPLPLMGVFATFAVSVALQSLPYLADRLVAPRLPAAFATFVFPSALVSILYLSSLAAPFGTWGNPTYALELQLIGGLLAVTGLWGPIFLLGWLASVINHALAHGLRPASPLLAAWLVAAMAGYMITARPYQPPENSVIAAAITPASGLPRAFRCPDADTRCRTNRTAAREKDLFASSEIAVKQGANILLWSETAAETLKSGEAAFRNRAHAFAARHDVFLFVGLAVIPDAYSQGVRLIENKIVAITPTGIAWEYHKSKPVPGEPIAPGPGRVKMLDTPFGRIAAIICFDADFPAVARQAGKAKADILLVSANDWSAIASAHAHMAVFRGVENGVSLLRAASNGRSLFADREGHVLAAVSAPANRLLVSRLPVSRRNTPYVAIGDAMALLCLGLLAALIVWGAARSRWPQIRLRWREKIGFSYWGTP